MVSSTSRLLAATLLAIGLIALPTATAHFYLDTDQHVEWGEDGGTSDPDDCEAYGRAKGYATQSHEGHVLVTYKAHAEVNLGGVVTSDHDTANSLDPLKGFAEAKVEDTQGNLPDGAWLEADGEAQADSLNDFERDDPPRTTDKCDTAGGSSPDLGDIECVQIPDPSEIMSSTSTCL